MDHETSNENLDHYRFSFIPRTGGGSSQRAALRSRLGGGPWVAMARAGMMGGYGPGPGYGMGPGYGRGYGLGPGMMGGYGPGYGMGPQARFGAYYGNG